MSRAEFLQGSMVALLTPMSANEQIDYPAFERLMDLQVNAGTSAIVVASTTGEGPTLSLDEHVHLYRRAVQHAAGRIPVIAGVGSPSTRVACELAREAEHERVDAILCVTPYYNRPNLFGMDHHFTAIADAVGIPVVLYDVPHRTGVRISEELIVQLSGHPNIVGLKDATGDLERAVRLIAAVSPDFRIVSGDDSSAFGLMAAGGSGVISVAANVAPSAVRAMCEAVKRGDMEEAARLNEILKPLYDVLSADTNPVPAKWVAHELGLMDPMLRAPLAIPPALARLLAASVEFNASRHLLGK
ncbi:4-hydroxy-tetrahydrodipicolinate synthase [Paraburkholderia ultramafica]|uniref:4-hydroxy-tetrahydrodipicolinate synthase n=1 Tax=Paraburkholderia ultramafica TaxID=1544867 RepID=A0A6S7AYG4_9BURK|nr:4-hydroxy-tetrahydrodipicolinate synthase [Paraburkholderia ultramafica]CAB3779530.1 4-hydroxy-tetrahydrodipicolinate synthase [Paraburkholderia ultramafica]